MTIDGLNALTTLTAGDELPVWDVEASGEPTKKITASNLSTSVKSLGSLIGTGDLDSTPTSGSNKAVTSGGVYTAIQQSTAIENVANQFSISSTKGTISQKTAYRSGNVVALGFVLTASEAVSGGGGFGCTATVSDASLKPICRQAGSSSLPSIGCVNVDGTSSGMNIVVTAYGTVNAGTAFWVLATYICNG